MIIQIGDRAYPLVTLPDMAHELTFNQLMAFNRELAVSNISSCRTMADFMALMVEIKSLDTGALLDHPEGAFALGVMVWAARTAAGERLTLLEACDVSMAELRFVSEESDPAGVVEGKARRAGGRGGAARTPVRS